MTADPSISPDVSVNAPSSVKPRPLSRWRDRPERVAWFVILLSFAIFLLLLTSIPLALRTLYHSAAVSQSLRFEPTIGTVLLYQPRSDVPIALTDRRDDISEGSRLVTTGVATQGILSLPVDDRQDDLIEAIHLYPGTSLEILQIRRPYFAGSDRPYTVRLRLQEGRVRMFTKSAMERSLEVQIETPHGEIHLDEGNYVFSISAESSEVSVKQGAARLFQEGQEAAVIRPGLRTWMRADGRTSPPVSIERNLVRGGTFEGSLQQEWEIYIPPYITPGTVKSIEQGGRHVVRFYRKGENDIHTEVGIRQTIDQDVSGYDSLVVRLDVRLIWQTLEGAGEKSSEFPLRVELTYTDIYGKVEKWGHGFYYMDLIKHPEWPLFDGQKLELFAWYHYESPNLMEELAATRPAYINSIRLYASGWNYEALAREVELIVE